MIAPAEKSSPELVTSRDEETLWRRFIERRDAETRSLLIAKYAQFAKRMAASMYSKRPFRELEFDDYLQYARVGLLEAVDRYDPARGATFATFAGYRIKGAILNGIENTSELTAQSARRRSVIQERVTSIHAQDESMSGMDQFAKLAQTAIDLALGYVLEDIGLHHDDLSDDGSDIYNVYELKQIRERLAIIVDALPERERAIIKGHYFEHRDFAALAEQLGLTKGRISQLHARGLTMLREAYRAITGFNVSI